MDSESERIVSESEVPRLLIQFTAEALQMIKTEKYREALEILSKSEELLEAVVTQGGCIDQDTVLVTLHSTALCYQRLDLLEECSAYLDGCVFNAKYKSVLASQDPSTRVFGWHLADKLFKYKYQCKTHVQLCATLSQLNKHDLALHHAKQAAKFAFSIFQHLYKVCTDYGIKGKKTNKLKTAADISSGRISDQKNEQLIDVISKAMPAIEYVFNKASGKTDKKPGKTLKIDMRSVLGVQHYNDWIHSYNIGDLMTIEPITLQEIKISNGIIGELSKDSVFENVCLIVATYFCIATEIRFICSAEHSELKVVESQVWHYRALDIAKTLLPKESPLLSHIKQSYNKHYPLKPSKAKVTKRTNKLEVSFTNRGKSPIRDPSVKKIYTRPLSAKRTRNPQGKTNEITPIRTRTPIRPNTAKADVQTATKSPKQKQEAYTERIVQAKKIELVKGTDHTKSELSIENKNSKPQETPIADTSSNDFISITQPAERSSSSEGSFDADFFKENFVISSNELYGVKSDSEEEIIESNLLQSNIKEETQEPPRKEGKNDYMPLIRLLKTDPKETRIVSSTGGHN